jgi:hypothetical protein
MPDSSWDNGGRGVPAKTGMPLWGKLLLGCGIVVLIGLVTCVGGVAFLANRVKKDPEGFKQKAMSLVVDRVRPDWEDFRIVVEQLRTPEGCQALYAANPGLATTWPTEAAFLEVSSRWHKDVVSAPDLTPDLMEHGGLRVNHDLGGHVSVGWSPSAGRAIYVTFERARRPGDKGPRRVVEVEVR